MADQIWFRGENGALHCMDVPLPPGIAHRLQRGDLTRVNADGSPWQPPGAEPPQDDDGPLPDGAPGLPRRSASQKTWADFATSQGMDEAKAAVMTRDELVEEFTRDQPGG